MVEPLHGKPEIQGSNQDPDKIFKNNLYIVFIAICLLSHPFKFQS